MNVKTNLFFIFLFLIPLACAINISSINYKSRIIISPSEELNSTNYRSRIIVSQPAVEDTSSASYRTKLGFLFATPTTTTTTTIQGGTGAGPGLGTCEEGYYLDDGTCIKKPIFLSITEIMKTNYLLYFLLGGFLDLIINYFGYRFVKKKKEEKENEED